MIGKTLGHYEIIEALGAGGMGEVYRARDTKLERDVAIKVLPPDMAADPERLARFEREAKAVAALDHPNIVTVHSVEEADDCHFITMQLVEGTTLTELIPPQGLTVEKLFGMVIPLAEAVAAAHQQGITHRDLKPANVMVSSDGRVRILDFGLAKLHDETSEADAATQMGTGAADLTEEGKILGTVAYMSPEQAEGKPVDPRSDVFTLGILIYELATGERPFQGDTKISILSSVVKDAPTPVTERNPNLPRHLGRIVNKCLEKDPARRYQSALGLRNDLEGLRREIESGELDKVTVGDAAAAAQPSSSWGVSQVAAAVVLAALTAGAAYYLKPAPAPEVWLSHRVTTLRGAERQPSLAPDGETVFYSGYDPANDNGDLDVFSQRVDGGSPTNLTANSPADDRMPAVSPDGSLIVFRSERDGGGLYVMRRGGEDVIPLTDFGYDPAWSPYVRMIVFSSWANESPESTNIASTGLWIVDPTVGEPQQIHDHGVEPAWSPNGHRIAFFDSDGAVRDIYNIARDGSDSVRITNDIWLDFSPAWSPDGRYLYFASTRGGDVGGATSIWRVAIDERSGAVRGAPEPVTTAGADIQADIAIAADGSRIAYSAIRTEGNLERIGFDPAAAVTVGNSTPITYGSRKLNNLDVSPDGEYIVLEKSEPSEDLSVMRPDGSEERNLWAPNDFRERDARFSPDGSRIAFRSNRSGQYEIWAVPLRGGTSTKIVAAEPGESLWQVTWAPSGNEILAFDGGSNVSYAFALAPPAEQPGRRRLTDEPPDAGRFFAPWAFSPDGNYVAGAFQGDTVGGLVILTVGDPTPDPILEFGLSPTWLADGRRILIRDGISFARGSGVARGGDVYVVDLDTREYRLVMSLKPDTVSDFGLSPDQQTLYFIRHRIDADIYTLEQSR